MNIEHRTPNIEHRTSNIEHRRAGGRLLAAGSVGQPEGIWRRVMRIIFSFPPTGITLARRQALAGHHADETCLVGGG
jgi:hypothetical protein